MLKIIVDESYCKIDLEVEEPTTAQVDLATSIMLIQKINVYREDIRATLNVVSNEIKGGDNNDSKDHIY